MDAADRRESGGCARWSHHLFARRLSLASGGSLVVTGPNGSGKSTLLRVLASSLPASRGTVRLEGVDAEATVSSVTHYLGHENAMKTALTVTENLAFWQKFLGDPLMSTGEALRSSASPAPAICLRLSLNRPEASRGNCPHAGQPARHLAGRRARPRGSTPPEARSASIMADHVRGGGILIVATHQPLGLEGAMKLEMGEV